MLLRNAGVAIFDTNGSNDSNVGDSDRVDEYCDDDDTDSNGDDNNDGLDGIEESVEHVLLIGIDEIVIRVLVKMPMGLLPPVTI